MSNEGKKCTVHYTGTFNEQNLIHLMTVVNRSTLYAVQA